MKSANVNINLPLNFNQVVDLVKQLPYKEKLRLTEVLKKETTHAIPTRFEQCFPIEKGHFFSI